jgi:ketosteroid isomerase-like protein
MPHRSRWFSLAALAAIVNCTTTPTPATLSEQDLATIRAFASNDSAIVMARNRDALAAEYVHDDIRMRPNQLPVQGRDAIRKWLDQLPPNVAFIFHLDDVQGAESIAYLRRT